MLIERQHRFPSTSDLRFWTVGFHLYLFIFLQTMALDLMPIFGSLILQLKDKCRLRDAIVPLINPHPFFQPPEDLILPLSISLFT